MPTADGIITLEDVHEARRIQTQSPLGVVKTPLLRNMSSCFPNLENVDLYLKLENMQTTGSFKVRGVATQMACLPPEIQQGEKKLITMSAGNYGKAFAYALQKLQLSGLCIMPLTAPSNRMEVIKNYGVAVEQYPTSDLQDKVDQHVASGVYQYLHSFDDDNLIAGYGSYGCAIEVVLNTELQTTVQNYISQGSVYCHPFDDPTLIAGYGSSVLEILEDGVTPDIVVVCCGGGGLVSGVAATLKLSGHKDCRVYAVEPEGSRTMYESFKQGEPVTMAVKSVAAGLSPPFAGKITYQHCKKFVEDVILVTDTEILSAMKTLYFRGLVAEPSGCAAMAALLHDRIPDVAGKKVVIYITGGNVSPDELAVLLK